MFVKFAFRIGSHVNMLETKQMSPETLLISSILVKGALRGVV